MHGRDFLKYKTPRSIEILSILAFLIVFLISTFSVTREIFLFQKNRVIFTLSSDYLHHFTSKPGGLLEYSGNFLTQGCYNYASGVLILSIFLILAWVVLFKINKLLSKDDTPPILFTLIPVCLLMICQGNFYNFIHYTLGYLTAAACFLFTIKIENKQQWFVFLVLFPLLFYVNGSFSFIYAGMCITRIIEGKKGSSGYVLPVLLAVYVYLTFEVFKNLLFFQPVNKLLVYPLIVPEGKGLPLFLFILIGYTVLSPWILKAPFLLKINKSHSGIISATLLLSVIPFIFLFPGSTKSDLAEVTRIEEAVYEQDWDSVINLCENSHSTNLTSYYKNLALANKNQLCDRMFFTTRSFFGAESLTLPRTGEYVDKAVYYYYTIGLINEAHHLAYESMVKNGYRPENIKMLIKTNLINKKYRIAERYINILSKTIHFKNMASHYREMLNNPVLVNSDIELGKKIDLLPKNDFFIRDFDDQNIELFLMANPYNKTAFEYKIARLLFDKDIETMIYEVKYMKGMGYTRIPVHIEEAILIYSKSNDLPDLGGLAVSSECETQFAQFNITLNLHKNVDKSVLKSEMKEKWGNTFWYYFQFE